MHSAGPAVLREPVKPTCGISGPFMAAAIGPLGQATGNAGDVVDRWLFHAEVAGWGAS